MAQRGGAAARSALVEGGPFELPSTAVARSKPSLLWLGAVLAVGCASPAPPPAKPAAQRPAPAEPETRATFTSQIGGMNQEAVEKSFATLQSEVIDCLERGSADVEGLGGSFTLDLRISMDGGVRWVHLSSSNLGHRQAERCIIEAARSRSWPQPKGGEGKISHTYAVDAVVPVHEWEPKRLRTAMPEIRKQIYKCLEGARGRYEATLYIRRDGRVASAGAAPPRHQDDAKVDCLVEVLRTFRFGWQRQKLSKVTFSVP